MSVSGVQKSETEAKLIFIADITRNLVHLHWYFQFMEIDPICFVLKVTAISFISTLCLNTLLMLCWSCQILRLRCSSFQHFHYSELGCLQCFAEFSIINFVVFFRLIYQLSSNWFQRLFIKRYKEQIGYSRQFLCKTCFTTVNVTSVKVSAASLTSITMEQDLETVVKNNKDLVKQCDSLIKAVDKSTTLFKRLFSKALILNVQGGTSVNQIMWFQ